MTYNTLGLSELLVEKGYIRGPFGSSLLRREMLDSGEFAVYEQSNAIKNSREFRFFIDRNKFNELKRFAIRENDLIISCSGTVGRISKIEGNPYPGIISQALLILRSNEEKILPDFLKYFLQTKKGQHEILNASHGSVQVNIAPRKVVERIPIPCPDIKIQDAICKILLAFDKKIELNQQMNETLEEIAKTLFKSWFIDFDPVRAKAEGRSTGLSKEICNLLPHSFENSQLGEIPEGWGVRALDEIAEFLNGLALQKYPEDEECLRYPVLKIAQLREGSTKNQNAFSSNIPDKYIVRNGDYIFSWSGSLLAKFWLGGDAALNQHLFKVTSQNYPKWFFAGWVENHLDKFSSIASSKATTMGHIKRSDLKDAKTVVPPIELISSFGEYFSPLREKANLCLLENNILSELRDTLLPKLISGELKISDTESLIEEVGV